MQYFEIKADLQFMKDFLKNVYDLWQIESEVAKKIGRGHWVLHNEYKKIVRNQAASVGGYQHIRSLVATGSLRAIKIADAFGIPIHANSFPAPAVGGPVIPLNLFSAILNDTSYNGIDKQVIIDAINQTIEACEIRVKQELWNLINPLYWVKTIFIFIIRIPFLLIKFSGFNVDKIEEHIFSKLFKVIELGVLIIILLKYGFNLDEIVKQVMLPIFTK
ncbi:hypothetical protein [Candidatus Formimonas warabiya]|uniref:Uncharacterized protein n=1 Tax=Formimonas warabiya TaxID=1761012 RepID=A0A3G1KPX4_FORW1|nr:hypothetical protein [Candidatus Formimonas warabiya]ATW24195.1 hypothetical protein DCMF_04795 [Candidatus Formimonas warabiya]